jgi:hypothetical protein
LRTVLIAIPVARHRGHAAVSDRPRFAASIRGTDSCCCLIGRGDAVLRLRRASFDATRRGGIEGGPMRVSRRGFLALAASGGGAVLAGALPGAPRPAQEAGSKE